MAVFWRRCFAEGGGDLVVFSRWYFGGGLSGGFSAVLFWWCFSDGVVSAVGFGDGVFGAGASSFSFPRWRLGGCALVVLCACFGGAEECPTKLPHKSASQEFLKRVFSQECRTKSATARASNHESLERVS